MSKQTLPYPNAQRQQWDTIRVSGYDIEVVMKNDTFVTFPIEMMRRLLNAGVLTTEDVRAIVRDELRGAGGGGGSRD